MQIPILYRDDDIVVVDKPIGMASRAPADDAYAEDALHIVRDGLGLEYLGLCGRLDTETSGTLLFALRRERRAALTEAFAAGTVEQVYLALVHGAPQRPAGTIDAPIAGHGALYRVTTPRNRRGQPAVSHYRVLETAPGERFSLLEVRPESGHDYQVRAHLAHLGIPVVGDPLYAGGAMEGPAEAQRRGAPAKDRSQPRAASSPARPPQAAPRLGLHAHRLTIVHPGTGMPATFTAPPPRLFTRLATGLPELVLAGAARHVRSIRPGAAGLLELLALAVARRAPLAGDPSTTIYRLINAAADGLPGLAMDCYGQALVVSIYDETNRPEPLAAGFMEQLVEVARPEAVYVKYRRREAARVEEAEMPALAPGVPVVGRALGEYPAHEAGLAYLVRPGEGWNPGIFPDMREMRARVRAWAPGKRVLNCFAYTCGFGVAATAGGAARVVNLDVSRPSLDRGQANYRANGFVPVAGDFLYGDAFDWLAQLARRHELFDLVILDPPGFARTKQHVFSAAQNYGKLAQLAASVVAPDGLLVACCNVAELSMDSFRGRVVAGLDEAWRAAEIMGACQAPVLDFPAGAGRESHLKILVARLA